MKNINAYTEANEEFNKAVENLMNEGWKINTGSMNGTQGEVAKIDLTKDGTKIIRIVLNEEYECKDKVAYYYVINQYEYESGIDYDNVITRNSLSTLWLDDKHFKAQLAKIVKESW